MSSDRGASWTCLEGWMTYGGALAVSPADEDVIFTTGTVHVQGIPRLAIDYSLDGGSTWNNVIIDDGYWGYAIAFDPFNSSRVFVAGVAADNSARLLVSDDLGQNWTQSQSGLPAGPASICPDPATPDRFYCGTFEGVYLTTDAGENWQATGLTDTTRALLLNPDDGRIYAGTSTGVYYSEDGGNYWEEFNFGLTTPNVLSLALAGGTNPTLYAGTNGGGVFITTPMTGIANRPISPAAGGLTVTSPCRDFASVRLARDMNELSDNSYRVPSLSLFDASGRLVLRSSLDTRNSQLALDVRGLNAGTYILRLSMADWSVTQPLVVTH